MPPHFLHMIKIKMLTGLAGPEISLSPGDVYETTSDEAARLIEAGYAVPFIEENIETTQIKAPENTKRKK